MRWINECTDSDDCAAVIVSSVEKRATRKESGNSAGTIGGMLFLRVRHEKSFL